MRFVTRNYTFEEGNVNCILKQLKWESLKTRRTDNRLILLLVYKVLSCSDSGLLHYWDRNVPLRHLVGPRKITEIDEFMNMAECNKK